MKHFQLFVTLFLLVCLVGTTAVAGVAGGKKLPPQTQGTFVAPQQLEITEADIPAQYLNRARSSDSDVDYSFAVPPAEVVNSADLAKFPTVSAVGLAGTYTIPGDFSTISAAVGVLNFVGLSGNTVFVLASASYTELAGAVTVLGSYPGAGTYSLTIQPASGVAVTVNFIPSATQGKGLSFNGAKNVTVDGLNSGGSSLKLQFTGGTFPSSDKFAATVYMTGNVNGVAVNNSTIKGQIEGASFETMTNGRAAIFVYTATGGFNQNIEIDGNTIIHATYGFKVIEQFTAPAFFQQANNVYFTNNNVGGAFGGKILQGVLTEAVFGLHVDGNVFDGIEVNPAIFDLPSSTTIEYDGLKTFANSSFLWNFGQYSAIHVYNWDGLSTVTNNWVRSVRSDNHGYGFLVYGITARISNAGQGLVANNRITGIVNHDGAGQALGFRTTNVRVVQNSVRLVDHLVAPYTTLTSTGMNNDGASVVRNNVFQNQITGGVAASTRGINAVAAGVVDYSAIHSTGFLTSAGTGTAPASVAAGINPNGVYGYTSFTWDLHADSTAPTAAENIGGPFIYVEDDVDGDTRDTTFAGIRDAGADEFPNTGVPLPIDIFPVAITSPPAGGVPAGVPQIPTVTVKNNSQSPVVSSITLTISVEGYSDTKPVSLTAGQTKTVTFASWTPIGPGPRVITATTLLADAVPANNILIRAAQPVDAPVVPPAIYTFNASAEGWTGAVDWKRKTSFAKLGGVNGGSGASWVTERPDNVATYTDGSTASAHGYATNYPGANFLTSPWLDISGFAGTNLYISLQHSIEVEPLWDRAWLQYTVNGTTWIDLGVLNDANGINWYNEALYEHAALDPANWDDGTSALYGLGTGPPASWTSNDNGTTGAPGNQSPDGTPAGYVYAQLKVTETSHAALVGATAVRFRYVAFSDASVTFGGWAFDNFTLSGTAPVFPGGTINGHAWHDVNGNGVDDLEADYIGTDVVISLFGTPVDTVQTNGTGDYTFSGVTLPAGYVVEIDISGIAFTVPFGTSNTATVNHPATGGTLSQNFGTFAGSISGKKYSDLNNNGVNDADPGLAGWTIEVHRDSTAGLFVGSDVTDVNGNYTVLAPAYVGVYKVTEVAQPTVARQTGPVGGIHTASVTGGTPTVTGKDFGNFVYGRLRVQLTVDQNGNSTRDVGDIIAVPSGSSSSFKITKNGVGYTADSVFTLGNGVIAASYNALDLGTYVVQELDSIAGWRRTKGGLQGLIVTASGQVDTADYLDFKYLVISGTKFNDLNGNGVKEGGEPGLSGWTIAVVGGVYFGNFSTVTDGSGNYSIDSVFTGSHVVGEVVQSGWTRTMPSGPGTYAISGISGNFVVTTGKDFGNFDNTDVSGIVYRDYNGNGIMDGPDAAMSGVSVDLAVNGGIDVSDGSGYSFNGQIDVDTVRITVPVGFVISQPLAGKYPVALLSGGAATAQNFGLFQTTDSSTKYRTFTAAQLGADAEKKPGKTPKAGKPYDPIKNKPNTANLVDQLIGKTGQAIGAIKVGLFGQLNAGGKTKAHVVPNKQSAFWGSLNNKSAQHTGMARGFDVDVKGKPFLKLQKKFGPNKKQNNKLFGELLALQLNLVASGLKTPAGLGSLIYSDPLSDFDGMTIDEIADYADTVMTNFEFMPLSIYAGLDTVVAKINGAFDNPATDDTLQGWASPKLTWKAYTSVYQVSYLKPNPGVAPKNRHAGETVDQVPTEFALSQNYPNPFNPTTTIEFELPQTSIVTLKVYNLLGQEVATLFDREEIELSETVEFDASSLPSGVYLYRIVAETIADVEAGIGSETFTQVKKMVLVK